MVNPALKDAVATVSYDSISYGKPLICVESGGYTRNLKDCAIIIKMNSKQVINELCEAMLKFTDPVERKMISKAVLSSKANSWNNRGDELNNLVFEHLTKHDLK